MLLMIKVLHDFRYQKRRKSGSISYIGSSRIYICNSCERSLIGFSGLYQAPDVQEWLLEPSSVITRYLDPLGNSTLHGLRSKTFGPNLTCSHMPTTRATRAQTRTVLCGLYIHCGGLNVYQSSRPIFQLYLSGIIEFDNTSSDEIRHVFLPYEVASRVRNALASIPHVRNPHRRDFLWAPT